MNVYRARVAEVIKAPYLVEQLVARENAVIVGCEEVEKLKFLGRNVNAFAAKLEFVFLTADLDIFKFDNFAVAGSLAGRATAQNGFDARGQFLDIKGFDHVVIGTKLKTEYLIKGFAFGGNHDNGFGGNLADFTADLPTVKLGQHNIEEHQVRLLLTECFNCRCAVICDNNVEALFLDIESEQLADIGVIINDKNFFK